MGCRAFALLVAPPDVRPCSLPRQISGRRAACPPARRPRRELRSARRLVVRPGPAGLAAASNRSGCLCGCPGQAPPPPTGTAARPAGPSGALHTSGAGSMIGGSARRLVVRPGPAAAHRHRGQARWTFRRPPHQWGRVYDRWLGASTRCPARPRRPSALRPVPPPISTAACPAAPSGALHFCLGNFARNSPAVSMGGSNEFVECFCWGAVVEGGSGAVVELVGDGVEVGLVAGDGGSFG